MWLTHSQALWKSYPDLRIYLNCGRLGDFKLAPEGLVASCFSVHRCPEGSWYQLMVSGFPWVPQTFTQLDRTDITWYKSICRNLHRKGETEKNQSILKSPARNLAMGPHGRPGIFHIQGYIEMIVWKKYWWMSNNNGVGFDVSFLLMLFRKPQF